MMPGTNGNAFLIKQRAYIMGMNTVNDERQNWGFVGGGADQRDDFNISCRPLDRRCLDQGTWQARESVFARPLQ